VDFYWPGSSRILHEGFSYIKSVRPKGGVDSSALLQSKLQYEDGEVSEEEMLASEERVREEEEERNEKEHDENHEEQEEEDQADEEQEPEEDADEPACSSFKGSKACPKRCVFVETSGACLASTPKILPCSSFTNSGTCPNFCKWSKKSKLCQVRFKTCKTFKDAASCPGPCEFFDGKCQRPCDAFKNSGRCPSRCDWKASTCQQPGVKVRTFAGPKKQLGAQPKGANKAMEAQYGPSGDLILALPLVLQNLTKYSTAITASQSPGAKVGGYNGRRFGNPAADAALLLDNTAGFFAKLGSDPSAAALGVAAKCPAGSTAVIKDCLELALCACQSSLESQPNKKKSAKTYAMLEQVSAGFKDINFGLLDASLKTEATPGASFMEVYKHTDSFLEASAYTCPLKKSTARALLQEDEHTEVRAAA
jgi:hypothetical protein